MGLLAWIGFSAGNNANEPTNNNHQDTNTSEKDSPSLGSAIKIGFVVVCTSIRDFREEIVAVGTLFIAAFTIILGISTVFLYRATSDLVTDSKKSSQIQLRAYIVVHPKTFGVEENGRPIIQITVTNFGRTPALKVQSFARLDIFPYPPTVGNPPNPNEAIQEPISIQPKDTLDFPARLLKDRVFGLDEINKVSDGSVARLYAFGRIEYFDIFGDRHETPFATTISGGPAVRNILTGVKNPEGWRARFETVRTETEIF